MSICQQLLCCIGKRSFAGKHQTREVGIFRLQLAGASREEERRKEETGEKAENREAEGEQEKKKQERVQKKATCHENEECYAVECVVGLPVNSLV